MLDRLSESGGQIHVLFSGRTTFLENCQQLAMCDFQNKEEHHVQIEPLSENETADYLFHSCTKLADVDGDVIFTPEVVRSIYQVGGGNFRMTNILAEEAIQKGGDNTSFMVLLENVKDETIGAGERGGFVVLLQEYVEQYRAYLPHACIGVGIVLVCLLLLFWGEDEKAEMQPEPTVAEKVDAYPIIEQEPEIKIVEPETAVDTTTSVIVPQARMEVIYPSFYSKRGMRFMAL